MRLVNSLSIIIYIIWKTHRVLGVMTSTGLMRSDLVSRIYHKRGVRGCNMNHEVLQQQKTYAVEVQEPREPV
jgi:hypothetical protein